MPIGGKEPEKRYTSAASLSPGATELLVSRLPRVRILGKTERCNWPVLSGEVPIIMSGVKPNFEKIAELRPGIVLYDEQLFSEGDLAKLKEMGIDTFAIRGNSIAEFKENLYDLGRTLHGESEISEYVDLIHAAEAAADGAPPGKTFRVAVMMPGQGSEHSIAGVGSFYADAARQAGAEVVGPEGAEFVPVNAEGLLSWNPEIIFSAGDGSAIAKDPRLQALPAVKNKRVVPIDPDILLRRGARVDRLVRGLYNYLFAEANRAG
jgi:iron complex transport system substrate-binding protein